MMPPVGLSFEYPTMAQDLGTAACPAPALVSELLAARFSAAVAGGASQDMTVPSESAPRFRPPLGKKATLYPLPAVSGVSCTACSAPQTIPSPSAST